VESVEPVEQDVAEPGRVVMGDVVPFGVGEAGAVFGGEGCFQGGGRGGVQSHEFEQVWSGDIHERCGEGVLVVGGCGHELGCGVEHQAGWCAVGEFDPEQVVVAAGGGFEGVAQDAVSGLPERLVSRSGPASFRLGVNAWFGHARTQETVYAHGRHSPPGEPRTLLPRGAPIRRLSRQYYAGPQGRDEGATVQADIHNIQVHQRVAGCPTRHGLQRRTWEEFSVEERQAASRGWLFVQFIGDLLAALPGITDLHRESATTPGPDVGIDFVAWQEGRPLLVEAKAQTPQTGRRLQQSVEQLRAAGTEYVQQHPGLQHQPRLVVAFPGVLSPQRQASVRAGGVELWDGVSLQRMARRAGVFAPEFLARPEGEELPPEREPADELLRRLPRIQTGTADWPAFERFSEDLLNLLFVPPLNTAVPQSSNESGVNRRDFILPNYAAGDTFWGFLRTHYRGDFIIAEAKNYTKPVGKDGVLQLANYLSHHGTGLVGLLLTRSGLAQSGRWTSREQWLLHNKLIIGLNEDDYRQMLLTHRASGDPAELIRQRIEDFRLGI
jgi:hypothetical protein